VSECVFSFLVKETHSDDMWICGWMSHVDFI